uniref:Fibronectin type-III domain-containing protein n=1 Tax=Steinernema glaseri TaxID=37863 RepID=A0A1I8ADQ5_9BILA
MGPTLWKFLGLPQLSRKLVSKPLQISVFQYHPETRSFTKVTSVSVRIPTTRFAVEHLRPQSVYNITVQAGTDFGYGDLMWAAFSTLAVDEPSVLELQSRTPNSLTVKWPQGWLSTQDSSFTIKGSTIHSVDGSSKEISISSFIAAGKRPQYILRNLNPGATMNVTISTRVRPPTVQRLNSVLTKPVVAKKSAWAVFSTLPQGEYVVTEPRIAAETDSAVSIVWRPVDHQNAVQYQIRYTPNDGGASSEGELLSEAQLVCPKFGCEWNCALLYNLARRPRDYSFDVRAKVDGVWNKWVPIARRAWNLLERVCSINPPPSIVENEGRVEYMREVRLATSQNVEAWRYLLVVDRRASSDRDRHITAIDMARLSDKATSDHEQTPYYITAAFSAQEIEDKKVFRIGDGKVYGGYLNYPLENRYENPSWTLIPISQTENEIMEPRLKSCGINEEGVVECDMSVAQIISFVPWWSILGVVLAFLLILLLLSLLVIRLFCCKPKLHSSSPSQVPRSASPVPDPPETLRSETTSSIRFLREECPRCVSPHRSQRSLTGLTTGLSNRQLSMPGTNNNSYLLDDESLMLMIDRNV